MAYKARQPFSGSTTQTVTFVGAMSELCIYNEGGSDITVKVNYASGNNETFTVKAMDFFDEALETFTSIDITNAGGSSFRGYPRG